MVFIKIALWLNLKWFKLTKLNKHLTSLVFKLNVKVQTNLNLLFYFKIVWNKSFVIIKANYQEKKIWLDYLRQIFARMVKKSPYLWLILLISCTLTKNFAKSCNFNLINSLLLNCFVKIISSKVHKTVYFLDVKKYKQK